MSKRIVLKSFSALSFDGIKITVLPVLAMHSPQPTPELRPALMQDSDLPAEARRLWKADRTEATGHFPDHEQLVVNGSDRTCTTIASSAQ